MYLGLIGGKMSTSFSFFHARRASANMWWIIIGAVIALIVMVVLLAMFAGTSSDVQTGILDCSSKGGTCSDTPEHCKTVLKGNVVKTFTCPGEQVCCFTK